jgi:hypothetical protein
LKKWLQIDSTVISVKMSISKKYYEFEEPENQAVRAILAAETPTNSSMN